MTRYFADHEITQQENVEFMRLGRRPSTPRAVVDYEKIKRAWEMLLDEQDGDGYDDYTVVSNCNIYRYVEFWSPPPADLLVLGAGSGRQVEAGNSIGYRTRGTTLGARNIDFAKWKFDIDLEYTDNCSMPYPDESFDIVAGFQMLEHCHSPYLFLFECNRVLRPGGMLILEWPPNIGTHNGRFDFEPGEEVDNYLEKYGILHHACCWTPSQAKVITSRCNFENVEVYCSGMRERINGPRNGPAEFEFLTEDHPGYFSGIAPGQLLLRATRCPPNRKPGYMNKVF